MKSLSGNKEMFDPNKFYVVSEKYKTRIRPLDIRHNYAAGWIYIGFDKLVDFDPTDKGLSKWLSYKPEVKDTFEDFQIVDYQDVSPKINFGTTKKPKIASPYMEPKELKSCKVDLYFSLPLDFKDLQVYYGSQLILDTEIK
jgi:hypothetical protein